MANKRKKNQNAPRKAAQPNIPTMEELKQDKKEPENPSARGGRETVDALVIAIVLAFFIRTFQAEAFVIPTGSMAPTLMGAHKDVFCDQCGQRFRVNASEEGAETVAALNRKVQIGEITPRQAKQELQVRECVGGVCPECGYVQPIRTDGLERALPSGVDKTPKRDTYSGDRLVVSKYAYTFTDPKRWDVIVFKYPGNANTNYIKRLVGLSNEKLRVFQGDIFVKPIDAPADEPFAIARKPADQVMAMRQLVHDTDRDPASLYHAKWPLRWSGGDAWEVDVKVDGKNAQQTYRGNSEAEMAWLRYQHTRANENVWRRVLAEGDKAEVATSAQPALITDYTAYNSRILRYNVMQARQYTLRPRTDNEIGKIGVHWTGDLMLEAEVEVETAQGRLALELVEAGDHYRCLIDVATGEVQLLVIPFEGDESTEAQLLATAPTSIRGPGRHEIRFANFDDQLTLWIDGRPVEIDGQYDPGATLAERRERIPKTSDRDPGDLSPAGVGIEGGNLKVSRLRIYRDIYYIAASYRRKRSFVNDLDYDALREVSGLAVGDAILQLPFEPDWWVALKERQHEEFAIGEDQFFMMGDNSAESLDSRLWFDGNGRDGGIPGGAYLERSQLVGKAICVYWPHAWYSVPFTNRFVPAWPNFADMRLVR